MLENVQVLGKKRRKIGAEFDCNNTLKNSGTFTC